jgi:thioredoxin 1
VCIIGPVHERAAVAAQEKEATMAVSTITAENFESEVINSDKPVLIDFWASWCGPCRAFSPIVDEFAEGTDAVKVGKVNVDEQPELA